MTCTNCDSNKIEQSEIAIGIIKLRIESLERTIKDNPGIENIGVRIHAQAKIIMLSDIIEDIRHTIKKSEK